MSSRQRTRRQRFLCRVPHIGHSVKPLPSVTSALGKKNPTSTLTASLPSATSAALGKEFFLFFLKILCRVPYSCTRQRNFFFFKKNLCRVPWLWHSAKLGNWVSASQLCRVPWSRHSAKPSLPSVALGKEGENAIFWFFAFHQHKQRNHIYINTQHMIYHIHIHIPSHTHP